jgi:hypothetical protein
MKPPIIIDNHGDLLVFESVEEAQGYLEPMDVKNLEYEAFDSEGRLLNVKVIESHEGWKASKLFGYTSEQVVLESVESLPQHVDELRKKLISFLVTLGGSLPSLTGASLSELVEKICLRKGNQERHGNRPAREC